jgi:hypothetical protein
MVTTTLAVLALAGGLSAGNAPSPSPSWQKDYAQALAVASSELKPVAVFIGHGTTTPTKMVVDGRIPTEAARLLRDKYVCVFIDTDTPAGKELAGRFAVTEGLVISGPGGQVQALRHSGAVEGADLTGKLTQYATTGQPATTATTGVVPAAAYQPAPVYQPAVPTYRVAPAYYGSPFGGTPNCVGPR